MVKNPPAIWEPQKIFLGQEYPLEEEMATHPNILAGKNPTDRGTRQVTVHGVAESDPTEQTHSLYSMFSFSGEPHHTACRIFKFPN